MSELQRRAELCIAHGSLTNSKRPETFVKGVYPTHVKRSLGSFVWDTNGNKYYDFITGLGTSILGFSHEAVNDAIVKQLALGTSFSLGTELEIQLAEKLKTLFPFCDQFRFLKTGSEACSGALKIARTYWGISSENQDMQRMWLRETFSRVSQEEELHRWPTPPMQSMHQNLPVSATDNGNQAISAAQIRQYNKGDNCGEETCTTQTSSLQRARASEGNVPGAPSHYLRGTHQEIVRSMWRSELASPSSRLQPAVERGLAMSDMPQKGTRWLILSDGYHSHHAEFVSLTTPALGVPPQMGILPLNGNEDLIPIAAAVIIEPIITDWSSERILALRNLRKKCSDSGTLLIFDEVITGFRWPKFSVSNYYGIEPDLIILGKAIANGMPLAVIGGKEEIMSCGEYFISSTFAGETLSLASALKTIELLQARYNLSDLWLKGAAWLEEFNTLWPEKIQIEGYPTRGRFVGDEMTRALFFQEAIESGMLFGPSWFFNFPLADKAKITIELCRNIICKLKQGNVRLRGELPKSPFAEKMRQAKSSP